MAWRDPDAQRAWFKAYLHRYHAETRQRAKAGGICAYCQMNPAERFTRCLRCRRRFNRYAKAYRARHRDAINASRRAKRAA